MLRETWLARCPSSPSWIRNTVQYTIYSVNINLLATLLGTAVHLLGNAAIRSHGSSAISCKHRLNVRSQWSPGERWWTLVMFLSIKNELRCFSAHRGCREWLFTFLLHSCKLTRVWPWPVRSAIMLPQSAWFYAFRQILRHIGIISILVCVLEYVRTFLDLKNKNKKSLLLMPSFRSQLKLFSFTQYSSHF